MDNVRVCYVKVSLAFEYVHPNEHAQPTYERITSAFWPKKIPYLSKSVQNLVCCSDWFTWQ